MNKGGHPATLRAAQPGNRNAVKSGFYSRRVRAERAEEIRAAAIGISTLALARAAVRDEVPRLERILGRLDADIVERGPSTRAGAARGQLSQRSNVSRQLAKLGVTWAMSESVNGGDGVDCGVEAGVAGALREELLGSLALRDLLDHDLEHRGVSRPGGGERRQVTHRLQVSRDLVMLADRIRTEARRAAQHGSAPLSTWAVACEIASDASQPPSDVIAAARYLFTHPAPRITSPEEAQWQAKLSAMSEAEIEAAILKLEAEIIELEAADCEAQATPEPDVGAATEDEPEPSEAPGTEVVTICLEMLQRIGDGLDPRASGRDRMRAAELREEYLASTNPRKPEDVFRDEIMSWTDEQVARELESLLDVDDLAVDG